MSPFLHLPADGRMSEKPSQSGTFEPTRSRMNTSPNEATPGERGNAPTEGLTTDYVGVHVAESHSRPSEAI